MARVFIAIGSNIWPEENVREAIRLLRRQVQVVAISTFYRTEAKDRPEQPPFYNGIVEIETKLPPAELKHGVLRRIEERLGRTRTEDKYDPRSIDLDVVVYGDLVVATEEVMIPDPEIANRAFLAIPLRELAPDLVLPGSGVRMAEIAAAFAGQDMEPLHAFSEGLRRDLRIGL